MSSKDVSNSKNYEEENTHSIITEHTTVSVTTTVNEWLSLLENQKTQPNFHHILASGIGTPTFVSHSFSSLKSSKSSSLPLIPPSSPSSIPSNYKHLIYTLIVDANAQPQFPSFFISSSPSENNSSHNNNISITTSSSKSRFIDWQGLALWFASYSDDSIPHKQQYMLLLTWQLTLISLRIDLKYIKDNLNSGDVFWLCGRFEVLPGPFYASSWQLHHDESEIEDSSSIGTTSYLDGNICDEDNTTLPFSSSFRTHSCRILHFQAPNLHLQIPDNVHLLTIFPTQSSTFQLFPVYSLISYSFRSFLLQQYHNKHSQQYSSPIVATTTTTAAATRNSVSSFLDFSTSPIMTPAFRKLSSPYLSPVNHNTTNIYANNTINDNNASSSLEESSHPSPLLLPASPPLHIPSNTPIRSLNNDTCNDEHDHNSTFLQSQHLSSYSSNNNNDNKKKNKRRKQQRQQQPRKRKKIYLKKEEENNDEIIPPISTTFIKTAASSRPKRKRVKQQAYVSTTTSSRSTVDRSLSPSSNIPFHPVIFKTAASSRPKRRISGICNTGNISSKFFFTSSFLTTPSPRLFEVAECSPIHVLLTPTDSNVLIEEDTSDEAYHKRHLPYEMQEHRERLAEKRSKLMECWVACDARNCMKWRLVPPSRITSASIDKAFYCGGGTSPSPKECSQVDDWIVRCVGEKNAKDLAAAGLTTIEILKGVNGNRKITPQQFMPINSNKSTQSLHTNAAHARMQMMDWLNSLGYSYDEETQALVYCK